MSIGSPSPAANIYAVTTAYPQYVMSQHDVAEHAAQVFGRSAAFFKRMAAVYGNAGVETRHSCVPLDWYLSPHGWPERMALFEENALALLTSAAEACFKKAEVAPADIAALVTVSSTGVVTPSLDSLIQAPLGLSPDVQRLPVFGLGCAGGVIGLSRAAALAKAHPNQWVMFLCTELCGLTFRADDDSKANVIGTAIFGDGAAAVLLRAPEDPLSDDRTPVAAVEAWGEHTWPASRDIMGWRVEDGGLGVVFSPEIPSLIVDKLCGVTDRFLGDNGLTRGDLAGVICHPGGQKVLAALEEALGLAPDDLRHAREILRTKGNMSAVTVLAVLERAVSAGDTGRHLMSALGPGFSAGMALIDLL